MTISRRNLLRRLTTTLAAPAAALLLGAIAAENTTAQSYCGIQNRECLVFIANLTSTNQSYAQKKFYQLVEFGAQSVAVGTLTPRYNKVHVCSGYGATRAKLTSMLNMIAGNSSVKALDLIFVTHGLSSQVVFSDQKTTMSNVRWDIRNGLSAWRRSKLRMVFSTACYGSSHRYYWINAGFACASGGRRIYADSGTSYFAFLASWAGNQTFQTAVVAANASDPLRIQDNAAKPLLQSWGFSQWWDVNSYRDTSGSTNLRIYHQPN